MNRRSVVSEQIVRITLGGTIDVNINAKAVTHPL